MKKQLYTSIALSLALLTASQSTTSLALEPGIEIPAATQSQPLLGGMKYNDVTSKFTVDLAALNSAMNATHKIIGLEIFNLQDNPMTGYIAIGGQKVANFNLVKNIPQDGSSVALGQLNSYYLVVTNDDFAKLYQTKLYVMADQIKNGLRKDWQQKMQQKGSEFGSKVGAWLQNLGKQLQSRTN